jgi:ribosome-binding ATPase YchF (GTP1/OBG family)
VDEASILTGNKFSEAITKVATDEGAQVIVMNNNIEAQITELESADDKELFFSEYGLTEPGLNRLIRFSLQITEPHYLFYRRCTGSKSLDHSPGLESATGCQCDPQ